MTDVRKRQPKVCDYYVDEDSFSPGVAFCAGCALELNLRLISRVLGKDIIFVGTPSCSAPVLHGQNTMAWHKHAYYACTMTGVASSATGLSRYYEKAGIEATVVCHTGDGCAQDVGFQTLSGAAERNEKMIYVCYDNEGYMNTGIQQSSATPFGASTSTTPTGRASRGKTTGSKNMPLVMAMHDIPYVATATLSHLEDYAKKLVKAKEAAKHGFAYIHVFCPCVVGWRIPVDASIQVCRDAVKTNYFPLWEMEDGVYRITQKVKDPRPVSELTSTLGKFRHLKPEELAILQGQVDHRFRVLQALCAGSGDPGAVAAGPAGEPTAE